MQFPSRPEVVDVFGTILPALLTGNTASALLDFSLATASKYDGGQSLGTLFKRAECLQHERFGASVHSSSKSGKTRKADHQERGRDMEIASWDVPSGFFQSLLLLRNLRYKESLHLIGHV
jgi:hypothetical protein